jgi:hypothetical protein
MIDKVCTETHYTNVLNGEGTISKLLYMIKIISFRAKWLFVLNFTEHIYSVSIFTIFFHMWNTMPQQLPCIMHRFSTLILCIHWQRLSEENDA